MICKVRGRSRLKTVWYPGVSPLSAATGMRIRNRLIGKSVHFLNRAHLFQSTPTGALGNSPNLLVTPAMQAEISDFDRTPGELGLN